VKKAFTLVEIMIIISIIGILSAGIVSFLSDTERRKMLHAESCLNEMNASIKNFTNAAMTSKQLKLNSTDKVFPDYYFIEFQPSTSTSS
jgi:prepilin-type N-terminal cleavage/methylation domain-containing protein